jgi:hypothetical protein
VSNLYDASKDKDDVLTRDIRRYAELLVPWRIWSAEYQELADYVLPRKSSIQVRKTPGTKRTQKLFDSTAIRAAEMLASSMHGALTSSSLRWFYLECDDQELNENEEVRIWLYHVTNQMLWEFNRSNFASEAHESYLDLVVFGTACLFEDMAQSKEPGFPGLEFQSVPCGKYVVSEGPDGRVNTVFRSYEMSAEAIRLRFGEDLPAILKEPLRADRMYAVINGVYPAKGKKGPLLHQWDSSWFLYRERTMLAQKGFHDFPFMVPRWTKINEETYGRGPSHTALPDIRSLNKVTELELKALAKVVDPPVKILAGDAIGPVRLQPGAGTTVRSMDSVQPLLLGIDFKVSNLKSEQLKTSIREMYYSDQLQLQSGPQMTAEEVRVRYELMQRIMGPALGRLESEFLKPLIDRTFAIMMREQQFPPIPAPLLEAQQRGKISLKIRYEGPLARAQKAVDAAAIQEIFTTVEPLAQINPKVLDVIDFDECIRQLGNIKGVPPTCIRDADRTQEFRAQQAQEQADSQKAEQAEQVAGAAGKAAPMVQALNQKPEPGSPNAVLAQRRIGGGQAAA